MELNRKTERIIVKKFEDAQESLVLQSADFPLSVLTQMVETKSLDLDPVYQRRSRWDNDKRSQLIESFLMNVPVPPIYLSEDEVGKYSVIDGKQRLTAGVEFLRSNYKLTGLEEFSELNGARFEDLPRDLQSAISTRPYLRVITLLKQSDPELKYEVFERLNRGGEILTEQELRNSVYRGPLNDMIYRLAEHKFLKKQLKIHSEKSTPYRNMTDAEYVLRYFTLKDSWQDFNGRLSSTMNDFMRENQDISSVFVDSLEKDFERSITACERIFGEFAFRRPAGYTYRAQTVVGMFDAEMVAINSVPDEIVARLVERSDEVVEEFAKAFRSEEYYGIDFSGFEDSVRTATNTPSKVRNRIDTMIRFFNLWQPGG